MLHHYAADCLSEVGQLKRDIAKLQKLGGYSPFSKLSHLPRQLESSQDSANTILEKHKSYTVPSSAVSLSADVVCPPALHCSDSHKADKPTHLGDPS